MSSLHLRLSPGENSSKQIVAPKVMTDEVRTSYQKSIAWWGCVTILHTLSSVTGSGHAKYIVSPFLTFI